MNTHLETSFLNWPTDYLCDRFTISVPCMVYATREASDMTCDSDVMEKASRRWRGAVQQLADVV